MKARQLALAHAVRSRSRGGASRTDSGSTPRSSARAPRMTYLICTTPRSGSWLLSEGLASTSLAGNPREWFNRTEEQEQRARWRIGHPTDLTYPAYLDLVRAKSATANGVAGIKLHYSQFAELPDKLACVSRLRGLTGAGLLSQAFPGVRYLWLTRRDKARQAVSYQLAAATGTWWVIDESHGYPSEAGGKEPVFDPHAIRRLERALIEHESRWNAYFRDNAIEPLVVYYEDVVADYRGQIVRVLKWLGIPGAYEARIPPTRLKRQSTARNDEWLARYAALKAEGEEDTRDLPPQDADRVFAESSGGALEFVPQAWRQWVAQQKTARTPDDAIIEVLTSNGYSRALAQQEVARAAADPYLQAAVERQRHDAKAVSLLNVMGQLRKLDSRAQTIERRCNLSPEEFRDQYYAANRPVIICGLTASWRALTAWTPDYLKSEVGAQVVEVMTGRDADPRAEMNTERHRTPMRFADYVDRVYGGSVTNDYNLVANNGFFQRFATHSLLKDIAPYPPYLRPVAAGEQCYLWFGPAGTMTPLHHDTSNILAAQIVGRKRYRLIPASHWQYVYNHTGVFSDVDCEAPDWARHPQFRNVTIIDAVIQPGEVLFVPVGWWHHVRALDVSMTVSFTHFAYPNHFTWEPRP